MGHWKPLLATLLLVAGAVGWAGAPAHAQKREREVIERIRYIGSARNGRVVIELSGKVDHHLLRVRANPEKGLPERVVIDLENSRIGPGAQEPLFVEDPILLRVRTGQFQYGTARVVLDLAAASDESVFTMQGPYRIVIDLRPPGTGRAVHAEGAPKVVRLDSSTRGNPLEALGRPREEPSAGTVAVAALPPAFETGTGRPKPAPAVVQPTAFPREASTTPKPVAARSTPIAAGRTKAMQPQRRAAAKANADLRATPRRRPRRAVLPKPTPKPVPKAEDAKRKLKVVIDPGHGGKDPGATGVHGVVEKDIVLSVSKLLAKRLRQDGSIEVHLTRTRDRYLSLEDRTGIANAHGADLFVSVHANASERKSLKGIEVYYLNNTNNRGTRRLAAMENGIKWDPNDKNLEDAIPELSFILADMRQTFKVEESRRLADNVGQALEAHLSKRYSGIDNLGVKEGPFYVLVGAHMPCVLVEVSFLTNPLEGKRVQKLSYRRALADGIYKGIREYIRHARLAERNL